MEVVAQGHQVEEEEEIVVVVGEGISNGFYTR
jgi:hypothetical protein